MEYIATLITIIGFVIGLGAVLVIDLDGFLGRHSPYWTETTIRVHKVTKPLIWIGMTLVLLGTILMFASGMLASGIFWTRIAIIAVMITNGCFLSFVVSPELLRREHVGLARRLLPKSLQRKITLSFLVSAASWWGMLAWTVYTIVVR